MIEILSKSSERKRTLGGGGIITKVVILAHHLLHNTLYSCRGTSMASYRFVSRCRSLSQVFRRQLLCSVRPITIARSSGRLSRRGLSSLPRLRDQEAAVQQVSQSSKAPSRPRLATDKSAEPSPQSNAELLKFRSPPMTLTFTGGATIPVTTTLKIVTPGEDIPRGIWPVFRLMVRARYRCQDRAGIPRTLPVVWRDD
jgi:hypothetical protein